MFEYVFTFLLIIGLVVTPFAVPLAIFLQIIKKKRQPTYKKPQTKLEEIFGYSGN